MLRYKGLKHLHEDGGTSILILKADSLSERTNCSQRKQAPNFQIFPLYPKQNESVFGGRRHQHLALSFYGCFHRFSHFQRLKVHFLFLSLSV